MIKNVLFLVDGSINDPILHSQGIPLLKELMTYNYRCILVSFENKEYFSPKSNDGNIISKQNNSGFIHIPLNLKYSKIVPNWITFFTHGTIKILKIIKDYKIDILHCRSLFPALISLIIKLFFNPDLKWVYDNRGVFVEEEIEKGHWARASFKVTLIRNLEKKILIKCDNIVVVSKAFQKHLISCYARSILNIENKIIVISNKTKLLNNTFKGKINHFKNHQKIIAVYSGSMAVWQNVDELFKIFQTIEEKFPQIQCKIISYDFDSFILSAKSKSFLKDHINIVRVSPEEVQNQLLECNFGILLRKKNLINEVSSPIKFAEYLAAGLPVLVSDGVGDTEEIINKYKVGVVTHENYENSLISMLKLLEDKNIYERCLELAQTEFNIKDAIGKYKNLYDNLCSNTSSHESYPVK